MFLLLSGCGTSPELISASPNLEDVWPTHVVNTLNAYTGVTKPVIRIKSFVSRSHLGLLWNHGSAFFVEDKGVHYLVTSYHVVENSTIFEFSTHDYKPLDVKVEQMYIMPTIDVAVFKITSVSAKYTPYKMGVVEMCHNTTAIGFPKGEVYVEKKGIVLRNSIATSNEIEVGMSGGPLLNDKKEVVGVTLQKRVDGSAERGMFGKIQDVFTLIDIENGTK